MQVRKVVTGHDAKGRAVIARDERIDGVPIPGLGELAFLWGADGPATYPNAGNNPAAPGPFPPVGGVRFVIATYSPEFGVVLSGNVVVELDDGVEVLLSPGDVVVQNGTRHRWRVVGGVPAIVAAFIIGAHRR